MKADPRSKDFREDVNEMRRMFDQSFSSPDSTPSGEYEDYLAIRIAGRPYALRVVELARIELMGKIAALPGGHSWLQGLAGIKGKLVPVYSLELALGHDRSSGDKNWIAIVKEQSFGLAFDIMDGYFRIHRSDSVGTSAAEPARMRNELALSHNGELRTIVHLPAILAAIRERISSPAGVAAI
jgi:chemotaxis signal transduction protein